MTLLMVMPSSDAAPRWEDQSVFRINKETPHATKMPFPTAEEAAGKTRMESPWAILLNGDWKFHWAPTFEEHESAARDFESVGVAGRMIDQPFDITTKACAHAHTHTL